MCAIQVTFIQAWLLAWIEDVRITTECNTWMGYKALILQKSLLPATYSTKLQLITSHSVTIVVSAVVQDIGSGLGLVGT